MKKSRERVCKSTISMGEGSENQLCFHSYIQVNAANEASKKIKEERMLGSMMEDEKIRKYQQYKEAREGIYFFVLMKKWKFAVGKSKIDIFDSTFCWQC